MTKYRNDQRDGNVAFKCVYNDGGILGGLDDAIGFAGTCSTDNIIRNIRAGRVWCSAPENRCKNWYDADFVGQRPTTPCYESELLNTWSFGSGVYQNGDRNNEPIPMKGVRKGKVAFLTTRLPESREEERVVFAVFKISKVGPQDRLQGTLVKASRRYTLEIPRQTAVSLPYWRFKQSETQHWGTGLFRYVTDQEASDYLHALRPFVAPSPRDREVMEHLLECCGSLLPTHRHLPVVPNALDKRELRLKYTPGGEGEGERHRRLKNHIGKNPGVLGYGPGIAEVEHRFVTGDRADVVVSLEGGGYVAVEIEIEGEAFTRVGAHQALKYKALLLAKYGARVRSEACLVAYHVPDSTRAFCREHNIHVVEVPLV